MNENLFRKKNLDKVASPEQLDDYIRVSNPSAWAVLAAFIILLVGICVWGIFGRLDTTVSAVGIKEKENVVCYIKEDDRQEIEVGMTVRIDEESYSVTGIEKSPVLVDSSIPEYAKHVGNISDGEWVYCVHTDCKSGADGEVFSVEIVIESINPIYFVTN